jgi:hypothetical protein
VLRGSRLYVVGWRSFQNERPKVRPFFSEARTTVLWVRLLIIVSSTCNRYIKFKKNAIKKTTFSSIGIREIEF